MGISRKDALRRLDEQTIDQSHDWMIDWVEEEVKRLGRCLEWDEAIAFLRTKLHLEGDEAGTGEVLNDWLEGTDVGVVSWQIKGIPGVAWGNYATEEWAREFVEYWLKREGRKDAYTIELTGR